MRNREQGSSLFSSRTQEVAGVVEGRQAIGWVMPDRIPARCGRSQLFRAAPLGRLFAVPAAVAQRRLPCFQGRSPDTDGDPEAPPMIIGVRTNGTKAEPPTIVVSR
jgi:hypothetical protein